MGVSGQRHSPAALYPRGKDPRYPLDRRLGGPPGTITCNLLYGKNDITAVILPWRPELVAYLIKPRFWTLSIVTGYKNTTFRELALLPSSGKTGGPTQLGPLERASLSHGPDPERGPSFYGTQLRRTPSFTWWRERSQLPKRCVFITWDDGQSPKTWFYQV
jgi:hypothetical protein